MIELSLSGYAEAAAGRAAHLLDASRVNVDGVGIPLRVLSHAGQPNAPLVVLFHGSVNRAIVPIPAFEGAFLARGVKLDATVVSIADPLLERHPDLRAAWYAGAHDQDTRALLRTLVDATVQSVSPSRTVFAGGSTGGHPALVHASERPDSVAVVVNPIVNIAAYHPDYVGAYRSICWPDLDPQGGADRPFVEDVTALYAKPGRNTVIYLQNARDGHFWRQAVPFLGALRGMQRLQSVLFLSQHHVDHPGHTFPPREWARWIAAACMAADESPASIAAAAASLAGLPEASRAAGGRRHEPSAHDLALARRLRAWQIERSRS